MQRTEHDYNRCTTPAQERRGVQKRIIEQVEEKISMLSIGALRQYEHEVMKIKI